MGYLTIAPNWAMRWVDNLRLGVIVWPHSVLEGMHMGHFMGLSKGEWLEVIVAVHLVVAAWVVAGFAVIGIYSVLGG